MRKVTLQTFEIVNGQSKSRHGTADRNILFIFMSSGGWCWPWFKVLQWAIDGLCGLFYIAVVFIGGS